MERLSDVQPLGKYAIDTDGDGIPDTLTPEGLAEMQNDPEYAQAQADLENKVGNDPGLADFKNSLQTAEGLNSLCYLAGMGDKAGAEDVNSVFGASAQSSIAKLAVSQQLKANGFPDLAAPVPPAFESKVKPIIEKVVNGTDIFKK